jgi:hypothetical protein
MSALRSCTEQAIRCTRWADRIRRPFSRADLLLEAFPSTAITGKIPEATRSIRGGSALAEFNEENGPVMIAMPVYGRDFLLAGINPDKGSRKCVQLQSETSRVERVLERNAGQTSEFGLEQRQTCDGFARDAYRI